MALLLRTGASKKEGQVVVTHDPFGGWAEACVEIDVPCVAHVGPNPPRSVKEAVGKIGPSNRKSW